MGQRVARWGTLGIFFAVWVAAQEPSDSVKRMKDGKIEIKSTVVAPNGCYSAGTAVKGQPPGAMPVENAVLVTFPLEYTDGICTQALKPVDFTFTTDVFQGAQAVIVYVTDKSRESVSARAVALPGKRAKKTSVSPAK